MTYSPDNIAPTANRVAVGAATSPGPRSANEDAYYLCPPGTDAIHGQLYVVADGVGGQAAGSQASELAVTTIGAMFYELRGQGHGVEGALREAVEGANQAIFEAAAVQGVDRMGSTVVAAVWQGPQVTVAHVGDARAYLLQAGRLKRMTRDHTWVQEQVDQGTIRPEDAARHDLRHVVTRVLGNSATVETTIAGPLSAAHGDRLLLCSDGLHDAVGEQQIQKLMAGGNTPQSTADALLNEALQRETGDNTTVVVVDLGATEASASPPPTRSQRSSLLWLGILALGLLAVGAALLSSRLADDSSAILATTVAPPGDIEGAGSALQQVTTIPRATSTAAAVVPVPTVTPVPITYYCPIDAQLYIWSDELAETGDLCTNNTQFSLPNGSRMSVLDLQTRQMLGKGIFGLCQQLEFVQVQPENPAIPVGWVERNLIQECP